MQRIISVVGRVALVKRQPRHFCLPPHCNRYVNPRSVGMSVLFLNSSPLFCIPPSHMPTLHTKNMRKVWGHWGGRSYAQRLSSTINGESQGQTLLIQLWFAEITGLFLLLETQH